MTDVTEQVPTEVPATERLSHPRTLAEAVQLSPQGRLSLPPRGPDIPRPETTEVDHYGTSKHWTISEGLASRQSNRSVFSKSDFGGTEMPAFRNLETAYSPRAQLAYRNGIRKNPRNPPTGSAKVEDVVRKVSRPLDAYGVFSRRPALHDSSRRLCFRKEPNYTGIHGQATIDTFQPGVNRMPMVLRKPPGGLG